MEKPNLPAEQKAHLDTHLAGIGHNLGPKLEEHAETVQEQVSRHGQLRAEATNIRVRLLGHPWPSGSPDVRGYTS